MNVINAADRCGTAILSNGAMKWDAKYHAVSVWHIIAMCDKIVSAEINGEKAHRWLGWIQACMCANGVMDLDRIKYLNKDS